MSNYENSVIGVLDEGLAILEEKFADNDIEVWDYIEQDDLDVREFTIDKDIMQAVQHLRELRAIVNRNI